MNTRESVLQELHDCIKLFKETLDNLEAKLNQSETQDIADITQHLNYAIGLIEVLVALRSVDEE